MRQEEEGGKEARRLLEQGELDGAREVMEIVQEAHGSCLSPASELLLARIDLAQVGLGTKLGTCADDVGSCEGLRGVEEACGCCEDLFWGCDLG